MRADFSKATCDALGRRASFICSNSDCRAQTLAPSEADPNKFIYIGKAAHICAASEGGPRFDAGMTEEERADISNGIFLCSSCADMVDKNGGADYPVAKLREWRANHEIWVRENLNRSPHSAISVIDGEHVARGEGEITAIDAESPVFFMPGTRSVAEGRGNVTATRIGPAKRDRT